MSYDQYTINPDKISSVESRTQCDTSVNLFQMIKADLPLMAAPMPDVCNGHMAGVLSKLGIISLIHRFQSIEDHIRQYEFALDNKEINHSEMFGQDNKILIGNSFGLNDIDRFHVFYDLGCKIFCLDTANGANTNIESTLKKISKIATDFFLITGNVANKQGYAYLADLYGEYGFVGGIRVGIAGGSVCATRFETGVYRPITSSIKDCWYQKIGILTAERAPLIIADGGVKYPGDIAKALLLGADLVMAGGVFAGTEEAPGSPIKNPDGRLYKLYRGAASYSVQHDFKQTKEIQFNEGFETQVEYKGDVDKIISRYKAGLQSAMSYCDSKTIKEFKQKGTIEKI